MGRTTLVRQLCVESPRVKPRIGACITLRKNHVTDTGTVSLELLELEFGFLLDRTLLHRLHGSLKEIFPCLE